MPQSWSDWIAFIGAIVGTVAGIGGVWLSFLTLRRDRADLKLSLQFFHQTSHHFVTTYFPNARFYRDKDDDKVTDFVVFTVFNRGLRPIHLEKLELNYVDPGGPGSMNMVNDFDEVLTEDRRRASIVFEPYEGQKRKLFGVSVVDDLHRRHWVYAQGWSRWRRVRWYVQRLVHLRRERRAGKRVATNAPKERD